MKPSEAWEIVPWIRGNLYSEECECHPDADMGVKSLNCTNGVCMLGAIYLTIPDSDNRLDLLLLSGGCWNGLTTRLNRLESNR